MIEDSATFEVTLIIVKLDDLHFVLGVLNEGAQRQSEVLLRFVTEVD